MTPIYPAVASSPKCGVASNKGFKKIVNVLIYFFIFQNLFNAVSPYVTFLLNVLIALILFSRSRAKIFTKNSPILIGVYIIFIWFLMVSVYRGGAIDVPIFLKFIRSTLTISLLTIITSARSIGPKTIIRAINVSLGFHVSLVILQIIFPNLTYLTAGLFGFNRESSILDQYSLRKLGASSSYDTASLFSVASMLFFYLQFSRRNSGILLVMFFISFAAALMSSRLGIAFALLLAGLICVRVFLNYGFLWKCVIGAGAVYFLIFAYINIYPLFLHSFGISELASNEGSLIFAASDYGTTGTVDALTGEHLMPLDQPLHDLLIGFALDPNSIGKFTDIGYVKLIYHVGIVGTIIILVLHGYMLIRAKKILSLRFIDDDVRIVTLFLYYLIIIIFIFNYKSLEMYSRGIGDFIFVLFMFVVAVSNTSRRNISAGKLK